jgi:hypothetical protein
MGCTAIGSLKALQNRPSKTRLAKPITPNKAQNPMMAILNNIAYLQVVALGWSPVTLDSWGFVFEVAESMLR